MSNAGDKGTISIELVHEALQSSIDRGVDVSRVLSESYIDTKLLQSPLARVSVEAYAQFWGRLADFLDDEFFGMDAHPMRRGSFRLMCHSAVTAPNLEKALRRIIAFMNLIQDDLRGRLTEEGDKAVITLEDNGTERRLFSYGTWFILVHGLACGLIKRRIPVKKLAFRTVSPADDSHYRTRFCQNVSFGEQFTQLTFDANLLSLKVLETPVSLPDFIKNAPANLLVKYKNDSSISATIKSSLLGKDPKSWPELGFLAKTLCMSGTTLQRRLQAEGVSYQKLKDDFRRDIAIDLLSNEKLPISEVALRTGFQETSAFYRAFKKWTGVNPGAYRRVADDERSISSWSLRT